MQAVAQYLTAFSEGTGRPGESTWLVWRYEGDYTLAELMQVGVRVGGGAWACCVCACACVRSC